MYDLFSRYFIFINIVVMSFFSNLIVFLIYYFLEMKLEFLGELINFKVRVCYIRWLLLELNWKIVGVNLKGFLLDKKGKFEF